MNDKSPPYFSFSDNQLELWYRESLDRRALRFIAEFHEQAGYPEASSMTISEIVKVLNKALDSGDLKVDKNGIVGGSQ